MNGIYELRINITSGTSYDGVFPKNPINGARTISISHTQAEVLTKMIQTNAVVGSPPSTFETDSIEFIQEALNGNMRILVNFDCCDAIHKCHPPQLYAFSHSTYECMNLIVASLSAGYHVVCSDYSLKALAGSWESHLPGTCPIVLTGSISGNVQLIQDLEECRKALLPQQKPLADLTVPEKSNPLVGISRINCMQDTFRGIVQSKHILDANNEHYKVTVQTIINRPPVNPPNANVHTTTPYEPVDPLNANVSATPYEPCDPGYANVLATKYEAVDASNSTDSTDSTDSKYDLVRIGEYMGYLGQCSVVFAKFSGTLSCSSCHLSNLVETKTDPELVFKCADNMYGRALSDKMRTEYEEMPTALRRSYTDTAVRQMVSSGYGISG